VSPRRRRPENRFSEMDWRDHRKMDRALRDRMDELEDTLWTTEGLVDLVSQAGLPGDVPLKPLSTLLLRVAIAELAPKREHNQEHVDHLMEDWNVAKVEERLGRHWGFILTPRATQTHLVQSLSEFEARMSVYYYSVIKGWSATLVCADEVVRRSPWRPAQ
jgi:hypothetical protein